MTQAGRPTAEDIERAFASDRVAVEDTPFGRSERLTDDVHHVPRGTVRIGGRVILGYPHIGRVLNLGTGIARHLEGRFQVEEKVDGFNVRVTRIEGEWVAFTRGGFVCPFTTDRLPDLLPLDAMAGLDGHVVCAEVAGPDQPYLIGHPPYIGEDVRLMVFDVMRIGSPGFLPYAEKLDLIERHGLPSVARYGAFTVDELERLAALMRRLDAEQREGAVLKEESGRGRRVKYVTAASCVQDLGAMALQMPELPAEYFTNRLLRLALYEHELGAEPGRAAALGGALLAGLGDALRQVERDGMVRSHHRCRFRRRENAERLVAHLKAVDPHFRVRGRQLSQAGGYWVLEFDKVYRRSSDVLRELTRGRLVFD